jgi:hypothetical protein
VIPRVRSHLTYANVMASIAVFVALGGTSAAAVALKKNSVGTKQLKKNAVTSTKVKNGSLAAGDFKAGQLKRGPAGVQGPAGPQGPKGDAGTAAFRGWAVIENNGAKATVLANSGAVTAERTGPGRVTVTVPGTRSNQCAAVAMIDDTPAGYVRKSDTADTPGPTYELGTFSANGAASDLNFNVAVFC